MCKSCHNRNWRSCYLSSWENNSLFHDQAFSELGQDAEKRRSKINEREGLGARREVLLEISRVAAEKEAI